MSKRKRKKAEVEAEPQAPRWTVTVLAVTFLLVQVVYLNGALSPFRLPKETVAVIGILFALAFGVGARLRKGSLSLPAGPLALVLAALPALQLASTMWSASPRRAITAAAITAVWVAAALWMGVLRPEDRQRLVRWTAVGGAIAAGVILLQAADVSLVVQGASEGSRFRMSGLAGNPADQAMAAVLLLPLLLGSQSFDPRRWRHWVIPAILAAAVVVSQTLTGYAALGLLVVVWLIQQRSRKLWAAAAGLAVVAAAVAFAAGFGSRLDEQLWRIRQGDWYSLLSARGDGWSAAVEMTRSRPLTGVGAGNYDHAYYPSRLAWLERRGTVGRRGEQATHFDMAHCDPLQQSAELGALGALWMAALIWVLVRSRKRGDPLPLLAAAAATPFLLLHYPSHVAVGALPLSLVFGHLISCGTRRQLPRQPAPLRYAVVLVLLIVAVVGSWIQLHRLVVDLWLKDLDFTIQMAQLAPEPQQQAQIAAQVEVMVLSRINGLPGAAPSLWRSVGKARFVRGDMRASEEANRRAYELWPHEEAELGLGIAIANQPGRRIEALHHLQRVCRTNPALTRQIADPELKKSVQRLIKARLQNRPSPPTD